MIQKEKLNEHSSIKHVIAVMSGKGGVGKSSVTSLMAISLSEAGYKVGIMDADITGPSIPKVFGINKERSLQSEKGVEPTLTLGGIKVISINLMVEEEESPIVWRGPAISGAIKQFYTEVNWGELDYLLIDLPPGTGDVPLTIMQSLEITGAVIVATPQDLVSMIVKKSINMAKMLHVPVLGLVENMSYFECPDCKKRIDIFGVSKIEHIAKEIGVEVIAEIPIDPELVQLSDEGKIELYNKINFTFKESFNDRIMNSIGSLAK